MEPLRVGFFLDGYTLKKVNEYYRNPPVPFTSGFQEPEVVGADAVAQVF